jgi:hypothetical protein
LRVGGDLMKDIDAVVQRLRDGLGAHVLQPDAHQLEDLIRLVPNLPPDVRHLYSRIGGTRSSFDLDAYVMPPSEVVSTVHAFRRLHDIDVSYAQGNAPLGDGRSLLLLIYDNQSNYVGVHLDGEDAGKAFLLDHNEPDTRPKFESLAAALNAMADAIGDDEVLDATYIGGRNEPA